MLSTPCVWRRAIGPVRHWCVKLAPSTRVGLACTTPVPLTMQIYRRRPNQSQVRTKRQSHYFTVNLLYFFWSNSADNTISFLGRVCLTTFPQLNSWCLLRCGSPWARRGSEPAHRGLNWALEEGAWEGHQRRKISKVRMKLCSLEGQDMNTYNHIIASQSLLSFANFQTCNTPCGANWGSPANSLKHQ